MSILPNKKTNFDSDVDRLSVLPKNVIDAILKCLPIRDAARTSMLSRGWRYEWCTLTQIVIDQQSFSCTEQLKKGFWRKIVEIVDSILLLHHGPVNKFQISSVIVASRTAIDRWILFLSRNGIKEFTLNMKGPIYKLPSCFFSCADITYLQLRKCIFIPTTSFKGFGRLTQLHLQYVEFAPNRVEILLSSCPILQRLTIKDIYPCSNLKISARKLVDLTIKGAFDDLQFRSTSLLTTASIKLVQPVISHSAKREGCKIVEVFHHIPNIERLELLDYTLQHLAVGDVPVRLPEVLPMKHLVIKVNFEDMEQMLAAFCIFRSSPVMQKLDIWGFSEKNNARIFVEGFWNGEKYLNCTFGHLQVVKFTNFTGITSELKFVKYVLANAPVLDILHIEIKKDWVFEGESEMLKALLRFPRCSPKAELTVS